VDKRSSDVKYKVNLLDQFDLTDATDFLIIIFDSRNAG